MVMLSLWVGVVNLCKLEVPLDIMPCSCYPYPVLDVEVANFCVIAEGRSLGLGHCRLCVVH